MTFYKELTLLRDVLAGLYPAPGLARAIVGEAGISERLIDFDGSAIEFWKSILSIAQNNNQIQDLIDVARKHFPKNEELIEAEKVFHSVPKPGAKEFVNEMTGLPSSHVNTTEIYESNIQGMVQENYGSISMTFNDEPKTPSKQSSKHE